MDNDQRIQKEFNDYLVKKQEIAREISSSDRPVLIRFQGQVYIGTKEGLVTTFTPYKMTNGNVLAQHEYSKTTINNADWIINHALYHGQPLTLTKNRGQVKAGTMVYYMGSIESEYEDGDIYVMPAYIARNVLFNENPIPYDKRMSLVVTLYDVIK